jgi:hypothetical protein
MDEHDRQLRGCLSAAELRTLERALTKLHAHATARTEPP